MKKIFPLLIVLVLGLNLQAQTYKIIVNKANSSASKTRKEVSDLFLKKKATWQDGVKVVPVDQTASSDIRKKFTEEVHGKSVSAIKSFWQQAIFSGQNTPPLELPSNEEVIKFVSQNAGAIGYVSSSADLSQVKELKLAD